MAEVDQKEADNDDANNAKYKGADHDKEYLYGSEPGKVSVQLYEKLQGIQYGLEPDPYNWTTIIE